MRHGQWILLIPIIFLLGACAGQEVQTKQQNDINTHLDLARGYLSVDRVSAAIKPLEYVINLDYSNAMAWMLLGEVHRRTGDVQAARSAYEKAIDYGNHSAVIFNNYGTFLFQNKAYQQALSYFIKAGSDTNYGNRGLAYQNAGIAALKISDKKQARQLFKRALQVEQNLRLPYLELSEIAYDDKSYTLSKQYYQHYIKSSPQNARSLWLGIRLARVFNDQDDQASYALQLRKQYPGTEPFKRYQESLKHDS